ncbi:MAG TPA: response regulator [Gaiellaceae bacterium]
MGIKSPRVLVVDDDSNSRALCSINLLLEGLEVLEAEDGKRGLARALQESPDLVVTDVAMPGLNGFELAEALRRDESTAQIPLIFLSGEVDSDNEVRAHSLGALAYVTKPFDPPAFAKLVAGALTRRETGSVPID